MQVRMRNAILGSFFLVLLAVRLATAIGQPLQYDEPFWFVRGDFLIETLLSGDWDALQHRHWTVAREEEGRRIFNSYIATGTGTALLTGAGRLLAGHSPFRVGIDRICSEVFLSRLFHALISVLTPLALLLLARNLGLPWTGQLFLLVYLTFDPVVSRIGAQAHLESFLTLTIPAALLLFGLSFQRRSTPLCLLSGAVFGLAFANRINAGVVFIAALLYVSLRWWPQPRSGTPPRSMLQEGMRLGWLGLTGWAVFVLCFPPLWSSPLLGFGDFLYQQAALTGAGPAFDPSVFLWTSSSLRFVCLLLVLAGLFVAPVRSSPVFQMGLLLFLLGTLLVTLSGQFFERYLSSSLPGLGLAAGCTVAWAFDRCRVGPRLTFGLWTGVLLLSTGSMVSTATRQWHRLQALRGFYGALQAHEFSRIDVPGMRSSFLDTGADAEGPALRLASPSPQVELFLLDVLLTDGRRFHRLRPGWSRVNPPGSVCRPGDWRMAPASRRHRERENAIRYLNFAAWPCTEE